MRGYGKNGKTAKLQSMQQLQSAPTENAAGGKFKG
jgi:hypothetical protein